MSKENLEQRETHESILIEEKLIEEYIKKSGMKPEKWIAENGKNFRKIIDENPELIKEYEKNPEKTKTEIKKKLNEMKKIRARSSAG